jgi:hypothetical protein
MILIAHRGNINGKFESYENEPTYIDKAINDGFEAEIDVWYINGILFLGHDKPQYGENLKWFIDRMTKLWIHCKNIEAIEFFNKLEYKFNYFWHENDTVTLTSRGYIWAYPNKQPIINSIAVMPEINNEKIDHCAGICSDVISNYKKI